MLCVVLAVGLLSYPVYLVGQGLPGPQRHDRRPRRQRLRGRLRPGGRERRDRQPGARRRRHADRLRPVPAGLRQALSDARPRSPSTSTHGRPARGRHLVHNLEHGYTIVWYRDTAPADADQGAAEHRQDLRRRRHQVDRQVHRRAVGRADGAGFPEGKNVVLAHWYADPANPTDTTAQKGVRQACTSVSGAADQGLHDQVPVRRLPGARRPLSPLRPPLPGAPPRALPPTETGDRSGYLRPFPPICRQFCGR